MNYFISELNPSVCKAIVIYRNQCHRICQLLALSHRSSNSKSCIIVEVTVNLYVCIKNNNNRYAASWIKACYTFMRPKQAIEAFNNWNLTNIQCMTIVTNSKQNFVVNKWIFTDYWFWCVHLRQLRQNWNKRNSERIVLRRSNLCERINSIWHYLSVFIRFS